MTSDEFHLLGRSRNRLPQTPDQAILDSFENRTPARPYWVSLACGDFSSLCPVTGQPDAATLNIRYMPAALCVETKSLKYYLASFRNHPGFNEEIVNRIADDLIALLQPRRLHLTGAFASRGGIQLTVQVNYPDPGEAPSDSVGTD